MSLLLRNLVVAQAQSGAGLIGQLNMAENQAFTSLSAGLVLRIDRIGPQRKVSPGTGGVGQRLKGRGLYPSNRRLVLPDRRDESSFFIEGPRKIFAHLLTYRPTPEELAWWMCHAEEIDRRVRGTPYAAMIDKQVPAKRSSVLALLNMVADSLKLLPAEEDANGRWSAAEWSKHRQGWLFLTSTPETRERLLPLTSL